ncbi:MAG TPA: hypothetical protein VNZ03_23025 [Terriglobales bacterium]|jgi:hypothetical protein|nr:hypothetical protein [Terriglobales bacterium]
MRLSIRVLFALLVLCASVAAQTPCADTNVGCSSVPRLIRFTGVLADSVGHPRNGTVGVTFSVYSQASGGAPLWQETQNVPLDPQGRYAVLLGVTKTEGMPVEVFNSPEPRWLGVWPQLDGEQEHSRVVLVSVPYALKAADTETLQGLPASAFLRAPISASGQATTAVAALGSSSSGASAKSGSPKPSESTVTTPGGAVNAVPKFGSTTSIVNSQITDFNGMVGMRNLANILFADQFPGGVPDAIQACPAAGCVVYAYSPNTNLNLGTIDPGKKAVTLYLGPYTYKVTQITLENDLRIIGMGAGVTFLQSTDGSKPVVVIPQAVNGAATEVLLSGFHIYGASGNTAQDAIFFDSSGYFNSGVWYSQLQDIVITGFSGNGIHLKGTNADFTGLSQLTEFNRVVVFRVKGGGNALRIEGAAYELYFNDCEFDGSGPGDGTNIFIGGRPPNHYAVPIDINFRGLTSQNAATAVQIDGGWALSFYSPHHEYVWGVYSVASDLGPVSGLTISDAGFQTSGTNNGSGYLLNVVTPAASGIRFIHNHIMGPADTVVRVANGASIVYQDNLFYGGTNLPVTSGITTQVTAASIVNIGGAHTVGLIASTLPITTIQANLGAGETATFYAINGPVTFGSGGNINLLGASSVTVTGSITFIVSDLGKVPSWIPISQWAPSSSAASKFVLTSSTENLTIAPGETGTANLTLTPQNGFSGSVNFGCAVGAPEVSCSVLPSNVLVNGPNGVNVTVSITSRASTLSTSKPSLFGSTYLALASFGWMGTLLPLTRTKSEQPVKVLALLAGVLILMLGCLGCGASSQKRNVGDPPSYYFPVVTASSDTTSLTVKFFFSVTVQ